MFTLSTLSLSLFFGFAPPLVWLFLWLQEDKNHPEPRSAIIKTFFLGSFAVLFAILLGSLVEPFFNSPISLFFVWAVIEEGLKLLAVLFALKFLSAPIDEPIDWLIYMITAALGFAALENVLFLLAPFSGSSALEGLVVSNLRFMGATVLHLVASATHGAALGLCFYLKNHLKKRYYLLGFSSAVLVHFAFNYFLIIGGDSAWNLVMVFATVWLLMLPIILIFEKVKVIHS